VKKVQSTFFGCLKMWKLDEGATTLNRNHFQKSFLSAGVIDAADHANTGERKNAWRIGICCYPLGAISKASSYRGKKTALRDVEEGGKGTSRVSAMHDGGYPDKNGRASRKKKDRKPG